MSRLYHKAEWFDELSPTAISESEFESLLIQNSDILRPDAIITPFKKTVYSIDSSARADLAIISQNYKSWMVVEVEMNRHSLFNHVIPQVRTLREGSYKEEHADYICSKNPALSLNKVKGMLRGDPPEILVIVNKDDEEWRKELRRYGVHMAVFEVYRSKNNRFIFVIDNEPPRLTHNILTELSFIPLLPNLLAVSSPAGLDFEPGVKIPVLIEGQITYWEWFQTATGEYLSPTGIMPIKKGQKYALIMMENGEYTIRPLKQKG